MGICRTLLAGMQEILYAGPPPEGALYHNTGCLTLDLGVQYDEWLSDEDAIRFYGEGTEGGCFTDAAHLAMEHPELTYVEGWASSVGIPIEHAWCVTAKGVVVDVTWASVNRKYSYKERQRDYFGVPIPVSALTALTLRSGYWGTIHNDRLAEYLCVTGAAAFATVNASSLTKENA